MVRPYVFGRLRSIAQQGINHEKATGAGLDPPLRCVCSSEPTDLDGYTD